MPEPVRAALPDLVIDQIAQDLAEQIDHHSVGHCVRVDNLHLIDAERLARVLRNGAAGEHADVHVLIDTASRPESEELLIPAERAVELRNRKQRQLVLLVPVGVGGAASSLDNSFERQEAVELLRSASDTLVDALPDTDGIRTGTRRIARTLGPQRPVEAWARLVATISSDPRWDTLGSALPIVGLIPDRGGPELVDRLARNTECVTAISRPARAVSSVDDRLTNAKLQDGHVRTELAAFLNDPHRDLSNPMAWTADLASADLAFEHWPLAEPETVAVDHIRVDPFLRDNGAVLKASGLRQDSAGDLPYAEAGEDSPASLRVAWTTGPKKTDAIYRWRLEVVPPPDIRTGNDDHPFAKITVAGTRRSAKIAIELNEADLERGSLFVVRVTGLDTSGQPVLLQSGDEACDESQQFTIRWEADLITGETRRSSAWALALGRLDAVVGGQNNINEEAYSIDDQHSAISLRLGGRRTLLLGVSPVLVHLQRKLFSAELTATSFTAKGRMGVVLESTEIDGIKSNLPTALSKQRKEIHSALRCRQPRDLVEAVGWDSALREQVRAYCQAYKRALDQAASDSAHRDALLAMDTLTLDITTAAGKPIRAVVVLPFHPLRLTWLAEYDHALSRWAGELANSGFDASRRRSLVDIDLVRRVTPANLPFAVPGPTAGDIYVHAREATVGTGIYLAADELEPGIAIQAVFDVLGIHSDDAATDVPAGLVTEHLDTYLKAQSYPEALRLLTINPGSGELLAAALKHVMLTGQETDIDGATSRLQRRVEVVSYGTRMSDTDPLPALTDLQRSVSKFRVGKGRSYLRPPLGLSVRPFDRLAHDDVPAHLCVLSNLTAMAAGGASVQSDSTTSFRNLLTPTSNRKVETEDGSFYWESAPAVRLRDSKDGRNKDGAADAVDAHRAHQIALAAAAGLPAEHGIALRVELSEAQTSALAAAHDCADWVLSIDRNVGLERLLPQGDHTGESNHPYILDYAPDFLEGIGPRLTVTTKHQEEIALQLSAALEALRLTTGTEHVSSALHYVQLVSGRLALRLTEDRRAAMDAAALTAYLARLSDRGDLDDTIVVPVDLHREMFSVPRAETRLCDIMLIRVTRQSIRMQCVTVLPRLRQTPIDQLADEISERLENTMRVLENCFLGVDQPRLDIDLQRARLAGILRHHAKRASGMGLLSEERLATAERQFARIEDGINPEISKYGCIVGVDPEEDFAREYRGVQIEMLAPAKGVAASAPSPSFEPPPKQPFSAPPTQQAVAPNSREAGSSSEAPEAENPGPPPEATIITPDGDSDVDAIEAINEQHAVPEPTNPDSIAVTLGVDGTGAGVNWRISTSGSPHMFILGIPGQGKSVTTRRILNSFAAQGLPALVLDFHGDMAADPAASAIVVDAADGLDFSPFELRDDLDHRKYAQNAWELAEVIGYVSGLGEIQRNVVYDTLVELYERYGFGSTNGPEGLPTMPQFARLAAQKESAGNGRNVAARIRPLSDFGLFKNQHGATNFGDMLRRGVVLDLHTLMEQVQLAASAFVLRKVYREMFRWGKTDSLRLALILDEAHRMAKDVTLPKIMKEGRKYGVAVVVASQGVDDFHRDVLGTAGTKVAFRCNFPQSKTVAGFLRGRSGTDMAMALEKLSVGQAYVSTPDSPEARKVFMANA
ncbi:hypothetical protein B7C42_07172 [Nocardia cerradoensis]|uniref:Helicase HerA central domain-containing protein n=1 Tax=Nocardia cerradoensis TaxID=85688 RepID=A0A231GVZ5_9NOCA|nr:DUF87 domain-containing protein [Nocardia cerradoensis]OXR40748.1 hypothetical protein B7C42_07172 [Nocardia cerradoensis]